MKKKLLAGLATALLLTSISAAAASVQSRDLPIGSSNIPIGASNEIEMVGMIEPTIMSVTMPTYVPFHISRAVEGENKVISPRITITNNSSVPVQLEVVGTRVDLSKLQGTTWSSGLYVGANQIAVGFQQETITNQSPSSLKNSKWLLANSQQSIDIMSLNAYDSAAMYVVGALGDAVPENNTFSVVPNFVVKQAK